ncbi:hypothetical protein ACP6PL_12905 [Dapis sp. BLCC M126]|uniref:hypothetical protein n=1 Tax=Dapis sp. BLCC M126 TaxID=3400189 RepID=UPI003CEA3E7C
MATNSKNSENINYTNGLSTNKLCHKIGMSMMSILLILLAAKIPTRYITTISTLEVPNQNQFLESQSNELEYIVAQMSPPSR